MVGNIPPGVMIFVFAFLALTLIVSVIQIAGLTRTVEELVANTLVIGTSITIALLLYYGMRMILNWLTI